MEFSSWTSEQSSHAHTLYGVLGCSIVPSLAKKGTLNAPLQLQPHPPAFVLERGIALAAGNSFREVWMLLRSGSGYDTLTCVHKTPLEELVGISNWRKLEELVGTGGS